MRELLRTNDPVLLNYAQTLLADAGIDAVVFDNHMSVMEGSLGVLPRRLMVADQDAERAQLLLREELPAAAPPTKRAARSIFSPKPSRQK